MELRPLGRSGLRVSVLSLGTMNFGADWHGIGAIDEKVASSLLDLALERGVNLIDTADVYGRGSSEEMLGRLLSRGGRRARVLLATKVCGRMAPEDASSEGLSARWIGRALDESLRRLRTDRVDLYMAHAPDPFTPIEETLAAFDRAVRAGKVRAVGVSNFSGAEFSRARAAAERGGGAVPVFDQVQYSLACRGPETDLVPAALAAGAALLAWSPLAGGLLSGKYALPGASGRRADPDAFPQVRAAAGAALVEVLRGAARLDGQSPAQAALGWIMGKPFVASAVVGARTRAQLAETLSARPLSPRAADLLDRASRICAAA
ncbi:MAG: aldo/keto reductase [Elusimicrobia bacterium]|nr:aldo/keto reductase [Elusimicrobiota bacterium]